MKQEPPEDLLTVSDLAGYVGVPESTIYHWNSRKTGPVPIRVGRFRRYRRSDVDAWLASNRARR